MSGTDYQQAMDALRRDLTSMGVVELLPAIVSGVHALLKRRTLRAGDALQLFSALTLRDRLKDLGEEVEFVCHDEKLRTAAEAEGLKIRL